MDDHEFETLWNAETRHPSRSWPCFAGSRVVDRLEKISAYGGPVRFDPLEHHLGHLLDCTSGFVEQAYFSILGRRANAQGLAHFQDALARGERTRLEVIALMRYSPEGCARHPVVPRRGRPDEMIALKQGRPWRARQWQGVEWLFSFSFINRNLTAARWLLSL
jgi:hypothetical protein